MTELRHKTLEATTTVIDQGRFTALAATYSVDRVGDQIVPGAFAKTILAWQESGKQLPLHWNHSGSAADVIGYIDVRSLRETDDGLFVSGKLDLDKSEVAKEAWRSMKNNAVSLSFGYLATKQGKRKDGINELSEVDVFEISIVPAPANRDTRFLSLKSAEGTKQMSQGVIETLNSMISMAQKYIDSEPDPEDVALMQEVLAALNDLLNKDQQEGEKAAGAVANRAALVRRAFEIAHQKYPSGVPRSVTSAIFKDPQGWIDANKGKGVVNEAWNLVLKNDSDGKSNLPESELGLLAADLSIEDHINSVMTAVEAKGIAEERMLGMVETLMDKLGLNAPETETPEKILSSAWNLVLKDVKREGTPKNLSDSELGDAFAMEIFAEYKATWTTAFINSLPDASFLHVESGGSKDSEGKTTPRSLRHFPYKDASGAVDLPHLRNALARIPQSNLPQGMKDQLTAKAQKILDNANKALSTVEEEPQGRSDDQAAREEPEKKKGRSNEPLQNEAWDLILKKVPKDLPKPKPKPAPEINPEEIQREAWALTLKSSRK